MKNSRGYMLIDVLVASSIVMMLLYTVIPMTSLLQYEREVLSDRRLISSKLHDELQSIVSNHNIELPISTMKKIQSATVTFQFDYDDDQIIKGCALWENKKQKEEEFCLYGWLQK